jgi:hypothetical protein
MRLFWRLFIVIVVDIDVATLYLCLMVSICRSDSCYLHQNRFPDCSLCYIDGIAFVVTAVVAVIVHVDYYSYVLDNHVVR